MYDPGSQGSWLLTLLVMAAAAWISGIHCAVVSSNEVIMNLDMVSKGPEVITCWTCPNKTDNDACNKWAPDIACPVNFTICRTVHRINVITRSSVYVNKQCVQEEFCTIDMIGCYDTDTPGVKDCISCCNFDYCNELVPSNHSTALNLSTLSSHGNTIATTNSKLLLLTTTTLLSLWFTFRDIIFLQLHVCQS